MEIAVQTELRRLDKRKIESLDGYVKEIFHAGVTELKERLFESPYVTCWILDSVPPTIENGSMKNSAARLAEWANNVECRSQRDVASLCMSLKVLPRYKKNTSKEIEEKIKSCLDTFFPFKKDRDVFRFTISCEYLYSISRASPHISEERKNWITKQINEILERNYYGDPYRLVFSIAALLELGDRSNALNKAFSLLKKAELSKGNLIATGWLLQKYYHDLEGRLSSNYRLTSFREEVMNDLQKVISSREIEEKGSLALCMLVAAIECIALGDYRYLKVGKEAEILAKEEILGRDKIIGGLCIFVAVLLIPTVFLLQSFAAHFVTLFLDGLGFIFVIEGVTRLFGQSALGYFLRKLSK